VALTIPQGTCKTRSLNWHGESLGGLGKQVSALMGFPGQDVLATVTDSTNLLANTRIHDLTIYVDQSVDVSCSPAEKRAPAGSCALGRLLENNSIFSAGGNGLTGTAGTGAGWAVGNCAIAMAAALGTGGTGDVLTGLIAGFLAQFPGEPDQAVAAAVYLHGLAGEIGARALGEKCLIATDILRYLPDAMEECADVSDGV